MTQEEFNLWMRRNAPLVESIRKRAFDIHADVNQHYDRVHPYGFHLQMVADFTCRFVAEICPDPADLPAVIFGAYFHDSIEDARLTYNDVLRIAESFLPHSTALMAAEIAYALTNEKGRTRAERADDRYYAGIRTTAYAPLVKMADRLANASYSTSGSNTKNHMMASVYAREKRHFMQAVGADGPWDDIRLSIPSDMSALLHKLLDIK